MAEQPALATNRSGADGHGDVLTAISEGLVALLKEFYGRGPTHAKSYEQTLLEGGRGSAVIEQRMAFQDLMRGRLKR